MKWFFNGIGTVVQTIGWRPVLWYLVHLLVVWVAVSGYGVLASHFAQAVDVEWNSGFYLEIPLLLILGHLMYFGRAKERWLSCLLPVSVIVFLYAGFDVFYSFMNRSPRVSDVENLGDIYSFNPTGFVLGCVGFCVVLLLIGYGGWWVRKYYTRRAYVVTLLVRVTVLAGVLLLVGRDIFVNYHQGVFEDISWRESKSIKRNGRLASFVYYTNQERENQKELFARSGDEVDIGEVLFAEEISDKRNVYMIVLESFVNPHLIENARYSKNPLSPALGKYLEGGEFSLVESPVYGGGSAQSEFELLTGVRALRKINAVDFNVLRGEKVNGFVNQLRDSGYVTSALIASDSSYFNCRQAYQSLGFDSVAYLDEVDDFQRNPADDEIFDGDLFDYSLQDVRRDLAEGSRPQFHYILGLYGHIPYRRNKQARPDVLSVSGVEEDAVERVANQFYYRTEVLGRYVDSLLEEDPTALIFVTSDHLPSLLNAEVRYKYDRKVNIAMMFDGRESVSFSKLPQYEVPWLLWDTLTKKKSKRSIDSKVMEDLYYQALREGGIGK